MNHFIVLTRGRTGSSVICDGMNQQYDTYCGQELFRALADNERRIVRETFDFQDFSNEKQKEISVQGSELFKDDMELPIEAFRELLPSFSYEDYFNYLNTVRGNSSFLGFKVLANHLGNSFEQISENLDQLVKQGVKVLLLQRREILREAFSIVIANERKIFNVRKEEKSKLTEQKVLLDLQQLKNEMRYILNARTRLTEILEDLGAEYKVVFFEDYLNDKAEFFSSVLSFIDIDGRTQNVNKEYEEGFVKVTPNNLADIVENYDEIMRDPEILELSNS